MAEPVDVVRAASAGRGRVLVADAPRGRLHGELAAAGPDETRVGLRLQLLAAVRDAEVAPPAAPCRAELVPESGRRADHGPGRGEGDVARRMPLPLEEDGARALDAPELDHDSLAALELPVLGQPPLGVDRAAAGVGHVDREVERAPLAAVQRELEALHLRVELRRGYGRRRLPRGGGGEQGESKDGRGARPSSGESRIDPMCERSIQQLAALARRDHVDRAAVARPRDQVERLEAVEHVLERLGLRAARVAAPDVEGEAGGVDVVTGPNGPRDRQLPPGPEIALTPRRMYAKSANASGRSPPPATGRSSPSSNACLDLVL